MSSQKKYVTLNEANFASEVLESKRPVLVDFWAEWCGPCRTLAPAIEELAAEFEGRAVVGKLDVDASAAIAQRYGIRSIPSLLFFRGGEVVEQSVGTQPKAALAERLENLLAAA